MKKKICIGALFVIVLWGIMFITDYSCSSNFNVPVFAIEKKILSEDENLYIYQGLGYSIQVKKQKDTSNVLRVTSTEIELFGKNIYAVII